MSKKVTWIGHVPTGAFPVSMSHDAYMDRLMRARGLLRKDGNLTRKAENILFRYLVGKEK